MEEYSFPHGLKIDNYMMEYRKVVSVFRQKIRELGYLGPMHKIIQKVDAEDQFHLGGICFRDILQDVYACSVFLLLSFCILNLVTGHLRDKRKVAWILSLVISVTEIFIAFPIVYQFFTVQGGNTYPYLYRADDNSRFSVILFISFMIMDLVLGNIFYPKQIDLLSGYVHHFFYLGLLTYSLQESFANAFTLFLPLEVPTAVLALGSIFSSLRSDLLFGTTFFLFRLLYHAILTKELIQDVWYRAPEVNIAVPACLAFSLHIYWFSNWSKKYLFPSNKLNKRKRNELRSNATWIEKQLSNEDSNSEKATKLKKELEVIKKTLSKHEGPCYNSNGVKNTKTIKEEKDIIGA